MKKTLLILFAAVFAFTACHKDPVPVDEKTLTGEAVDVSHLAGIKKLFVLNEGSMGMNSSSLDMLRVSDGRYITGIFKKVNTSVAAGLGDTGNDVVVVGDEVWIAMNGSGLVEVIDAGNEVERAAIKVPMPRSLAFDANYVYVSSWNGAVAVYGDGWAVDTEKSKNPKGAVYRINRSTRKVEGSVEVGYQPEGLAVYNGKLYVANSGGIAYSLPPAYSYDNTVSVIDLATFTVSSTVTVEVNLQKVFSDGKGNIYVSTFGDFFSAHSSLWCIKDDDRSVSKVADYASIVAFDGETVYCIGNENEFDYQAAASWKLWKCQNGAKADWNLNMGTIYPYGLAALPGGDFILTESDYVNPGTVNYFHDGAKLWSVTAGINPNHFAIF